MIEVMKNLYVGNQNDYESLFDKNGWAFVHACKDPYHRQLVGYKERALPKDHPEYLVAIRGNRMALNILDADKPEFFADEMINKALNFIKTNLYNDLKVLVHCNQGQSRSPSIAMLYMKNILNDNFEESEHRFKLIYPDYNPKNGIREYVKAHWR